MPKFFIVNMMGYVLPIPYTSYESACSACDEGEIVYLAGSLEELEYCLDNWEEEHSFQ